MKYTNSKLLYKNIQVKRTTEHCITRTTDKRELPPEKMHTNHHSNIWMRPTTGWITEWRNKCQGKNQKIYNDSGWSNPLIFEVPPVRIGGEWWTWWSPQQPGKPLVGVLYGGEAQLQGVWVRASWGERSTTPLDKLEDNTIEQHNTGDWHHTTGAKVGWITAFLLAHVSRCRLKNDYVKKKKRFL